MSRSISIWYKVGDTDVDLDTGYHHLLGTQQASMKFWSLPQLRELGLRELTELGHLDPVYFSEAEGLAILEQELVLLEQNREQIPFDDELKTRWIHNLRFCLDMLKAETPPGAIPVLMIG